jgi:hypothetical protein
MQQLTAEQITDANLANHQTVQFGRGRKTIEINVLAQEVNRVKHSFLDHVTEPGAVTVNVNDKGTDLAMTIMQKEATPEGDPKLSFPSYDMTEWAHKQLADKVNIPKKYYDRMRDPNHLDLLVQNVNTWIHENGGRRIRTLDGKVRAVLSSSFLPIDNWVVAEEFLQGITAHNLDPKKDVQACSISDTHMHIRATIPHMKEDIRKGDSVIQGLMVSNSEVGASSFKVEPFLLRLICTNGLIGPNALTRIHLGGKTGAGEFQFSDNVQNMETNLIRAQVKEIIDNTFNDESFHKWLDQIRGTTDVQIQNISSTVENFTTKYAMKNMEEGILDALVREGDPTQYGLVNAITRVAQDAATFEGQIALERIAGEISVMKEAEFIKKIVAV